MPEPSGLSRVIDTPRLMRIISLSLCAWLVACASTPQTTALATQPIHQQHLASLTNIEQFSIKGRLGVNSQGKGFSGGITWVHQPETDSIDIYTPLGSKVARIHKSSQSVLLTTQDGRSIVAEDAEALTETVIGLRLPLNGLNDWVLGRPTKANIDAVTWDGMGRISSLSQQGWEITYLAYHDALIPSLPNKISLKNPQLQLRLVVETWQTSTP